MCIQKALNWLTIEYLHESQMAIILIYVIGIVSQFAIASTESRARREWNQKQTSERIRWKMYCFYRLWWRGRAMHWRGILMIIEILKRKRSNFHFNCSLHTIKMQNTQQPSSFMTIEPRLYSPLSHYFWSKSSARIEITKVLVKSREIRQNWKSIHLVDEKEYKSLFHLHQHHMDDTWVES
jgi:hypothetical protein